MKTTISIAFDEEKLYALELEMKKEHTTVAQFLGKTLDELYGRKVPEAVREFIDSKAAAKTRRPPRSAPKSTPAPGVGMGQTVQEVFYEQQNG